MNFYNTKTNNDRWVVSLFQGRKNGYFVEAGALNGKDGSCTYTLERYLSWKGILVEPGKSFRLLAKNRPHSHCEQVCLSDLEGEAIFVHCSEGGLSGMKEALIESEDAQLRRWGNPKDEWRALVDEEVTMTTTKLETLLGRHSAPTTIDYMAFDLEGAEYRTLSVFPFEKYRVLAMSVEGDTCDALLLDNGFIKVSNRFNIEAPWESYFVHPAILDLAKRAEGIVVA